MTTSTNREPMLFDRQRRLLALLDALGAPVGRLDFQKLLFLWCQESSNPAYEFVPYKFGAFSFTSYADRAKLSERGLLTANDGDWALTDEGRKALGSSLPLDLRDQVTAFARRYRGLRGDALVADSYRRFPYYATRSEIAERVLAGDAESLRKITELRPARAAPGISTLGYESRSLEGYLNTLLQNGASLLCDVRRNPLSRKYGFSKRTLATGCEGVGLRYEHLPELGIASEERRSLVTQADYDALFSEYERTTLQEQTDALETIRGWVRDGHRVVLTCYERDPVQCHRRRVAQALERRFGKELAPQHL